MFAASAAKWAMASALACGLTSPAFAQQADNPLKSAMKILGFATDVPPAQDFVVKSRPEKEPDYIPVFQAPPEPAKKALDGKNLDKLKGDLDSVEKRADALRASFPPAAKAVAEEKAQEAAKAKTAPARQSIARRLRRRPARCYRTVTARRAGPTGTFTQGQSFPMSDFHRVRRLPPYVFEQVNKLKAKARAAGADIIDLGMGNPDLPAPKHVIDKLVETVGKPRTDRYSASKGIAGLRRAQVGYYARRFGVKLDPETQVVVTLGSKEGFANMAQAITAPGDVVLVPNPSYPIHAFGFLMAGGVIRSVPIEPTPDFFVALERAIVHSIPKPIAVVVCYPSNPTAMVASLDFYKDLVLFARRHEIFVLSDLAYAEVYFEDEPPPSVLQAPGAFDVAVEFSSMSKTFSMAGWRMGFAVGNERLLAALARVKSYLDYGAYTPIQVAAAAALNGPEDCIREMRATYKRRRDVMIESFAAAGWPIAKPTASMFAWTQVPEKFRHLGSLEFSKLLIEKADVAVAPGIGFGEHGDDYVRLALVENEQRIRQAARGVRRFFDTADDTLHNVVKLKQPA